MFAIFGMNRLSFLYNLSFCGNWKTGKKKAEFCFTNSDFYP